MTEPYIGQTVWYWDRGTAWPAVVLKSHGGPGRSARVQVFGWTDSGSGPFIRTVPHRDHAGGVCCWQAIPEKDPAVEFCDDCVPENPVILKKLDSIEKLISRVYAALTGGEAMTEWTFDPSRYEGSTPGPWEAGVRSIGNGGLHSVDACKDWEGPRLEYASDADKNLVADAPMLLKEVLRLRTFLRKRAWENDYLDSLRP